MNAQYAQPTPNSPRSRSNVQRARARRRQQLRRRRIILGVVAIVLATVAYVAFRGSPKSNTPITTDRVVRANPYQALPNPTSLPRLFKGAPLSDGQWTPAGREVHGHTVVYTTALHLPDQPTVTAGVAWMDAKLLKGQLYSGSLSPGGFNWKYTAPISTQAAKTLVVAFNGGFLLKDSKGGYYAEGRYAAPLVNGAASLVIYKNGAINIGKWGRDFSMTPSVIAVRQNLVLLIDHRKLAPNINPNDTNRWGYALNNVVDTWRSGIGITADGALVYAYGPMSILDLAKALQDAGSVRAMTLDMNPAWTVFATFTPSAPNGLATPANGVSLLPTTDYGPSRFFSAAYSRDFITLSAR